MAGEMMFKLGEPVPVLYQAPNAESGLVGVIAEIILPIGVKDSNFPDVDLVEILTTGTYKGEFTPDTQGEWLVIIHKADGNGKVIKRYSVGAYNVNTVGEGVAAVDGKVDTVDGKVVAVGDQVTTVDGKVDTMDGKVVAVGDQVTTVDGKVVTMDGKVVAVGEKVDTMDGKVVTMDGKVVAVSDKVNTVDGKADAILAVVAGINTAMGGLDTPAMVS